MASKLVVASAARTATGNSGALRVATSGGSVVESDVATIAVLVDITVVGADANETMDISVEWSFNGTLFAVADGTADTLNQMTQPEGVQAVVAQFNCKAQFYRLVWTMAGTTPEFTFSVAEYTP